LLSAAQTHYDLALQRDPGQVAVSVTPLPAAQNGCDMAVMTIAPDMAFIVDTVLMAIRDTEADIDWVMHPVLRLTREAEGRLTAVEGGADQEDLGDEESLVYVECSAPVGFDRNALVERIRASLDDLAVVVADYQPMRTRLHAVAEQLENAPDTVDRNECEGD